MQQKDIELAINGIIEQLITAISQGTRIEIRGFGGFTLRERQARIARNPKTGDVVNLPRHHILHFKPGLDLRDRVNHGKNEFPTIRDI